MCKSHNQSQCPNMNSGGQNQEPLEKQNSWLVDSYVILYLRSSVTVTAPPAAAVAPSSNTSNENKFRIKINIHILPTDRPVSCRSQLACISFLVSVLVNQERGVWLFAIASKMADDWSDDINDATSPHSSCTSNGEWMTILSARRACASERQLFLSVWEGVPR